MPSRWLFIEIDTDSAKFRNTRKSAGCSSIPQNPYFFLLPLVGLIPQTTRNQSESVSYGFRPIRSIFETLPDIQLPTNWRAFPYQLVNLDRLPDARQPGPCRAPPDDETGERRRNKPAPSSGDGEPLWRPATTRRLAILRYGPAGGVRSPRPSRALA